jgi:serine protease Do
MSRLPLLILGLLIAIPLRADEPGTGEEKGPYLGILFSPIPEALLDHLPQLPRDGGVLITHVLPDSPAAQAGLRKHDVLLHFNTEKIRDGNHLARLIQAGKAGQVVRLLLVRAGREQTVEVKIGLGPVLKIAKEEPRTAPGTAKPGGPATVSVTAVPMEGNRLRVTFEYAESGRIRSVTCAGDAAEIDREIEKLPQKVQTLARAAVKRLRELNLQKDEPSRPRGS